jgi:Ca2+-binding EF-hand superfamily protein
LEQFFLVLTNKNKEGKLKASKLSDEISKIYKNPEKAIEYSFRLMDLDDDKKITKAEFLSYIDNCFISLQFAAEKHITDE